MPLRIAVIGHVEHITIAAVPRLPAPGEIAHLDQTLAIPGGGGGVAFYQLTRSPAELHLFTAIGNDDAGRFVADQLRATDAHIHAVQRDAPHTRDLVLITPEGERTILVQGEPLHPEFADQLPWELLSTCDAVYFTAQDPALLQAARAARCLVLTARRQEALARSRVRADVVVGSAADPLEAGRLEEYPVAPKALVMTEGEKGGAIETAAGIVRFPAAPAPSPRRGAYGAGDSFAGALTWYLGCGLDVEAACAQAAGHAAAVLRSINPLESQLPLQDSR